MPKVCHITTIHPARDTRIFYKECVSLAAHGYEVNLLVANQETVESMGVKIISMDLPKPRLQRMRATRPVLQKALSLNADIYHFHDPELIPVGVQLKKQGKIVIYDAHEDVPLQILSKPWIPGLLRRPVSSIFGWYEARSARQFDCIFVASPPMLDRFRKIHPEATALCNFPIIEAATQANWEHKQQEIAYVGSLTRVRGIKELVQSLAYCPASLNLGGKFHFADFRAEVAALANWQKVNELGYLDRPQINAVLDRSKVGMVTLHPIINYLPAYAVKMFEYMAAGLPVVASDFPLWKSIIETERCGICVDPLNPRAIGEAVTYLLDHEAEAQAMGERGRRAAIEKYNWRTQEKVLLDTYERLLEQRK